MSVRDYEEGEGLRCCCCCAKGCSSTTTTTTTTYCAVGVKKKKKLDLNRVTYFDVAAKL